MIDKFLKSKFGQIVTVAFVVATATTAAIVGLYENIRIPTLNERISSRDDDLKREALLTASWKTIADQATNEVANLSRKLADSRDDFARLVERERVTALQSATNINLLIASNAQGQRFAINLKQTVLSVGDQETLSYYAVDKLVGLLEWASDEHWRVEYDDFLLRGIPKKITTKSLEDFGFRWGIVIGEYTKFRIRMGELRAFMAKRIHEHYRAELSEADKIAPDAFYEGIRIAPEIMRSLITLDRTLIENTNSIGWNSHALVAVESFMRSNTISAAKK